MIVKKGDLYFADLSPVVGSEQGGVRPVLVVQNDVGNKYSPTIIVAAVTSQTGKAKLPTHVELQATQGGLSKNSVVLLEQLRTIDKQRLKERIGSLSSEKLPVVDEALSVSLGHRRSDAASLIERRFDAGSSYPQPGNSLSLPMPRTAPDRHAPWTE